jgi:hypothetical protein
MEMQPETCSTDMQYGQAATCSIPNAAWTFAADTSTYMDMHQGHGHPAGTWTFSSDMEIQHRNGHAAWTWTCRRDMEIDIDMDMNMDNREKKEKKFILFLVLD